MRVRVRHVFNREKVKMMKVIKGQHKMNREDASPNTYDGSLAFKQVAASTRRL